MQVITYNLKIIQIGGDEEDLKKANSQVKKSKNNCKYFVFLI